MELDEMIVKDCLENEKYLSPYACLSKNAIRLGRENSENCHEFNVRPPFFRDVDRILHSTAYTRYMDKTQVFAFFNNDLITHRGLHVQFVAKIARTIGRALKLNEDLIEAISLGHDLGHVPYGHTGERCLNRIAQANDMGLFLHNVQSVRVLKDIENSGKGLNITLQVLDGILCHNGEMLNQRYEPDFAKTKEQFLEEYEKSATVPGFDKTIRPMTLEGCVVRISDVIAYIGRDIEDAILLGIIDREDIPEAIVNVLGNKNSSIINNLVEDLIRNSYEKPYIEFSKPVFSALKKLLDFNYKYIYTSDLKEDKEEKFDEMFKKVFEGLRKEIDEKGSEINEIYVSQMNRDYTKGNSSDRIIFDFIAGMTDNYFASQCRRLYLPRIFGQNIYEELKP